MKSKILVSACLMGFQVRYNGSQKAQLADALARWQREGRLVIHCPELAAGLPVPRLPAEILHAQGADVMQDRARIVESDGQDVTPHYQLAAWLALRAAQDADLWQPVYLRRDVQRAAKAGLRRGGGAAA